jgi:hypothetical protein
MLPKENGSKVEILSNDGAASLWMNWHGFVVSEGSPETLVMRRDFPSGIFPYPEPPRPASAANIRVITPSH